MTDWNYDALNFNHQSLTFLSLNLSNSPPICGKVYVVDKNIVSSLSPLWLLPLCPLPPQYHVACFDQPALAAVTSVVMYVTHIIT